MENNAYAVGVGSKVVVTPRLTGGAEKAAIAIEKLTRFEDARQRFRRTGRSP